MRRSSVVRKAIVLAVAVSLGGFLLRDLPWRDETVEGRVARLSSPWAATRAQAAAELAAVGDREDLAAPALTAALDDAEADVRAAALKSLATLGEAARPAVEKAGRILIGDPDVEARRHAAALLGAIREPASATPLAKALDDPSPTVVAEATRSLARFARRGVPFAPLPVEAASLVDRMAALTAPERSDLVRAAAVDAIDSFSDGEGPAVSALIAAATKDPNPVIRRQALALLRSESPATVAALVAATDDPDPQVVIEATVKLARVGLDDDRAIPALARACLRADERSREGIGMNLNLLKLDPPKVAPDELQRRYGMLVAELRKVLDAPTAAGRGSALMVLCRLAGSYERTGDAHLRDAAARAFEAVLSRLSDDPLRLPTLDQWPVLRIAVRDRHAAGAGPRDGLDLQAGWTRAMGGLLASPDADVRNRALATLRDGFELPDGGEALHAAWLAIEPDLIAALKADAPATRRQVVDLLERLGPSAAGALGSLRSTIEGDPDPEIRKAAARAAAAVSSLDGLKAEKPEEREAAAEALTKLGRRGASAESALIEILADPDPKVRRSAARALGSVSGPLGAAVGPLLDRLGSEADPETRAEILRALAAIAPGDAAVVAAEVAALGDVAPSPRATAAAFSGLPADDGVVVALAKNLDTAGPPAEAAAEALARMLFLNPNVALELAKALRSGAAEPVAAALEQRFQSVSAGQELRGLRDPAKLRDVLTAAVPPLVAATREIGPGPAREAAYATLGRILSLAAASREPADREAVAPALEPFLALVAAPPSSQDDGELRNMALERLAEAPTRRGEAATTLVKAFQAETDPEDRSRLLDLLARLATRADSDPALVEALKPVVAELAAMLDSGRAETVQAGLQALGHLGAEAVAFEPTLKRIAESDPRPNLRSGAEAALKAVRGIAKMPPPPPRSSGLERITP